MSDIFQRLQSAQSAIESIWPKCCGRTMHWWTQRQIDEGEMPVGGESR